MFRTTRCFERSAVRKRPLFALAVLSILSSVTLFAPASLAQDKKKEDKSPATGPREDKDISLAVGESRTVDGGDVKQYSEGPSGIADIRLTPDGKKFVVVGQSAGTTSLLLIKNDGTQVNWVINVFSQAPEIVENELKQLLSGYTGVNIRKIGSRLFIEGGVATEDQMQKIQQIADLYTGQVQSLVTVGQGAVDRDINVRIDFFFVQFNRSDGYKVGVAYPQQIGGPTVESTFAYDFVAEQSTAQAAVINQPLPSLDIASQHGWAKVLKQSTIITTNGNEATFKSGGELNFPITAGFDSKIEQIRFGTDVKILPRYDKKTGSLEVNVVSEIADLTPPGDSALPGRNTSQLDTTVYMKLGQSLVVSGIRTRGERHQIQGLPFLSRIPVLGVFFGSHQDQDEQVEGAIFVVPSIVESVPRSSYDVVKSALEQYEDYDGNIDDMNSFAKDPPDYGKK